MCQLAAQLRYQPRRLAFPLAFPPAAWRGCVCGWFCGWGFEGGCLWWAAGGLAAHAVVGLTVPAEYGKDGSEQAGTTARDHALEIYYVCMNDNSAEYLY